MEIRVTSSMKIMILSYLDFGGSLLIWVITMSSDHKVSFNVAAILQNCYLELVMSRVVLSLI